MTLRLFRIDMVGAFTPSASAIIEAAIPEPKEFIVNMQSSANLVLERKSYVSINFAEIGLDPGKTYTVTLPPGFFLDGFDEPSAENSFTFDTPATVPSIQSTIPDYGQALYEDTVVYITYDRLVKKGSGNFYLHDLNSVPQVLIATIPAGSSLITTNGNIARIDITRYLRPSSEYVLSSDEGAITDIWGLKAAAVPINAGIDFSTIGEPYFNDLSASLASSVSINLFGNYKTNAKANISSNFSLSINSAVIRMIDASDKTPQYSLSSASNVITVGPYKYDMNGSYQGLVASFLSTNYNSSKIVTNGTKIAWTDHPAYNTSNIYVSNADGTPYGTGVISSLDPSSSMDINSNYILSMNTSSAKLINISTQQVALTITNSDANHPFSVGRLSSDYIAIYADGSIPGSLPHKIYIYSLTGTLLKTHNVTVSTGIGIKDIDIYGSMLMYSSDYNLYVLDALTGTQLYHFTVDDIALDSYGTIPSPVTAFRLKCSGITNKYIAITVKNVLSSNLDNYISEIHVYDLSNSKRVLKFVDPSPTVANGISSSPKFGHSVDINGDTIVVSGYDKFYICRLG